MREGVCDMKINDAKRDDPTLRELLASASELAFDHSGDGKDAVNLTRQAFVEILRDAFPRKRSFDPRFHGPQSLN